MLDACTACLMCKSGTLCWPKPAEAAALASARNVDPDGLLGLSLSLSQTLTLTPTLILQQTPPSAASE